MRTTIDLDDRLVAEAVKATGIRQKTALLHAGLRSLIETAAIQRLIAAGGTMPRVEAAPRRRQAAPPTRTRRRSAA